MTPDHRTGPVPSADRIAIVDALRGLALFAVFAMNVETVFRVSIFQQFLPAAPEHGVERAIDRFLSVFFDLKAFALFSLLFGVGLAIQFDRLARAPNRAILLTRRLAALLAFGLVHLLLIWNGDILTEYAVAGFIVLPLLWAPSGAVAAFAAMFLAAYLTLHLQAFIAPFPSARWIAGHVQAAYQAYGKGGFGQVEAFRLGELYGIASLHVSVIPRTLGLFLVGVLAWRSGIVRQAARHARALAATAAAAIALGLIVTLGTRWTDLGTLLLAIGYAAGVLGCGTVPSLRKLLAPFEPLGRTAFTNYILQSLIAGWIFYGYGLGLFGRLSLAQGLAIVVVIYVGQMVLSAWWLRRFYFGPLEWLWRAIMYWDLPPFRKPHSRTGAALAAS